MNLAVKPGLPMLIAGSCSPCVVLSVSAIGVTDTADKNKEHSAKIFQFLTKQLGLSEDRLVVWRSFPGRQMYYPCLWRKVHTVQ